MPKVKFDMKVHEEKMRAILNPPAPLVTQAGLPNLADKIKEMGKKQGK